jgi:hypothetical protein
MERPQCTPSQILDWLEPRKLIGFVVSALFLVSCSLCYVDWVIECTNSFSSSIINYLSIILIKPFGPHILPKYLDKPVRVYKPKLDRNLIGIENKERTIIYQWINLINGKMYVGSAWNGSRRLLSY